MKLHVCMATATILCATLAHADEDHATSAQLDAFVKQKGQKLGAGKSSTLESPDFVDVHVKKGYCYTVEVKLKDGAKWKSGRRPSMFFPEWPTNPLTAGPSLIGEQGAVFEPNCSQKSGKVSFGLMTYGPDDHVGSGGYVLTVYERKPSAKEAAAESKMLRHAHEESIRSRDASRAKTCSACASESPASNDRRICLERRGLTMGDCGW